MASINLYKSGSDLSWSPTSLVTAIQESEDTTVTNSTGVTVYWWTGTGNSPSGGGTSLANTASATFTQGDTDLDWSFSDSGSGGAAPKATLKILGRGGSSPPP